MTTPSIATTGTRGLQLAAKPFLAVYNYMTAMMGGNSYAIYCQHLREHHPDKKLPTESEFWRERWAEQDRNPGARCC